MKHIYKLTLISIALLPHLTYSQPFFALETGPAWQSLNDQRIPGNTGTKFSLSDVNQGPFLSYRFYLGHRWQNRHELRALYAPLAIESTGSFSEPVQFMGSTFASSSSTITYYKFNSYRLTYAYHLDQRGEWNLAIGFTGKIRDAEVRLTQGALSQSKVNVGFVPLLHFRAAKPLAEQWSFRFDFDGLAAPQGRAIDAGFFIERELPSFGAKAFAGYRMIEGGVDNDEVYNFAWIHIATLGMRADY